MVKEVSIPVPNLKADETAEISLIVKSTSKEYLFRVEAFSWSADKNEDIDDIEESPHIEKLKRDIASYDKDWELIQIFAPIKGATHIQVLYRHKNVINTI